MTDSAHIGHIIDKAQLPAEFPTHFHAAAFWENLGRVVGSFGMLEEVLRKALFALTGTRPYEGTEPEQAVKEWQGFLEQSLSNTLHPLITSFKAAVEAHPQTRIHDFDALVTHLRRAAELRNVLCHGSWQPPDSFGRATPLFVDRKLGVVEAQVDIAFLQQTRQHVAELICEVMNAVTHMGYQFPGSDGPGKPVW